jgi:hypothetical protein
MSNFLLITFFLSHFFQTQIRKKENTNPASYFSQHIISADTEEINHNDSASATYLIGKHHIRWQYSDQSTFVTIDNHRIEISKRHTLNRVSTDNQNDSLSNVYILFETKLYSLPDREILAFEFGVSGCEGFSCRLDYQLFYDINTSTINFFGEYNAGNAVDLYSFDNSPDPGFISSDYEGNAWGEDTCYFVHSIYNLNSQGVFESEKDKSGKNYFIKTKCANFYGDCKIESKNWFEPIE